MGVNGSESQAGNKNSRESQMRERKKGFCR